MKNEIKNPMERYISNTEINLFGDGGVSDCDGCDDCNKPAPEKPGHTGTFICSHCGGEFSVNEQNYVDPENTICNACYAKLNNRFVCSKCGYSCPCSYESSIEEVCINCYNALPNCPVCGKKVIDYDRFSDDYDYCKTCGNAITVTVTPSSATVEEGESVSFTATVSHGQDLPVTWSAGGDKVSVSDDGTVTGISAGSATVTASIPLGASDSATVTVTEPPAPPATDDTEPDDIPPTQNTDFVCKKCKQTCPCSNRAYETDYCYECYSKFPTCPICQKKVIPEDRLCEESDLCKECGEKLTVSVHPENAKVTVGKTVKLTATVPHGQGLPVTWETEDTDKVSVSEDGTVTALGAGTATVTATIPGGAKATVTVEVVAMDVPHFEYSSANADTSTLDWVGSFSVDTHTGALSMELGEISVGGALLPVSIKHQYHSAFANRKYTKANNDFVADFSGMELGYGWRLNIMQSVVPTADSNVYAYINEDGECILLTYAEAVYDENGDLKYAEGYRNDDYDICYKADSRIMTIGSELTYLFTSSGWLESIIDVSKQTYIGLSIYYKNGKIDYVMDGAERKYKFEYNGDILKSITAPDGLKSEYTYANGHLTGITRGSDKNASITYNSTNGKIEKVVVAPDTKKEHTVEIEYTDVDRVSVVYERYGTDLANATFYEYNDQLNSTLLARATPVDKDDETVNYSFTYTYHTFDTDGNIVSSYNHSDEAEYTDLIYAIPNGDSFGVVKTANLLSNGSFESGLDSWTISGSNCTHSVVPSEENAKFGKNYYRVIGNSSVANAAVNNTVNLPAGDYTFSAYVRAVNAGESFMAWLSVETVGGAELGESEQLTMADDNYIRLETHFTLANETTVKLSVREFGEGTVFADGAMLERATGATEFNHIENSSFENGITGWSVVGGTPQISDLKFSGSSSVCLAGDTTATTGISQNVSVKAGVGIRETYTLSGWARADLPIASDDEGAAKCYIGARMTYTDEKLVEKTEEFISEFARGVLDWQNATVYIEKPEYGIVTGLTVFAKCENVTGAVFFDSISLVRDSIETELTAKDFPQDIDNENTSENKFSETQDDVGNNLTETTFGDDASLGAIYRSFTYTDDKNNLKTVRDERGNVTVYDVQNSSSRVLSETDPIGNKKEYEYDVHGRTTKVTHKDSFGTAIASVIYDYDEFDNLAYINRGDRGYRLEYNTMHQLYYIEADNLTTPLVSYGYTHGGRPKTVTYANGDVMTATYNAKGQIISERWKRDGVLTAHYKYVYDISDNLIRSIDFIGEKEYNYTYDDGVIIRSTECDITVNGEVITNRFPVNTIIYTYNGGTLVKKRIIPENGFDTEQVYTYPKDNGNTASCTFVRGDTTVTATSVTDGLGRAVSESITAGNVTISRAFTYTDGVAPLTGAPLDTNEYKPTTQLVSKMELSDGTVLDYEYDACGRITKVTETRNGTATVTEYTYDALGQLLTETVNGTPVNCMSYDSYGNIQEKNGVAYGYDAAWKDRLVSVGNKAITYGTDPCNPSTYFGNALVWEKGRQLKQFGNYTYKYNANGIRTRKTVNNINHFYFLDGTKILREKWGEDDIVPIYDTNESVIGLTHSTESGTNTYYFLKNLQGDIIAITDASGTVIARYKYDAWGKVLSVTDANGNSITSPFDIANVNPFRYRGYYYDTETGLYYLQSRYYDPGVGRFLNADDLRIAVINSVAPNIFSYCSNCATVFSDDTGYVPLTAILGSLLGAFGGVYIGSAIATGLGFRGVKKALCIVGGAALCGAIGFLLPTTSLLYFAIRLALSAAGSLFLCISKMPITKAMYEHSIWGAGCKLPKKIIDLTIDAFKKSHTFSAALSKYLADRDYVTNIKVPIFFKDKNTDMDLYLSVGHIDFYVSGVKEDNYWNLKIKADDPFDFGEWRKDWSFSSLVNNLGTVMEWTALVVPFDIHYEFSHKMRA